MVNASNTGGVQPMTITGRMVRERERCIGMNQEERAWRAQWLKDQILTEREPVYIKELHDQFRNPIRRLYLRPLDKLILEPLIPRIGKETAYIVRTMIGKTAFGLAGLFGLVYYFKYNPNDWTKRSGFKIYYSRTRCVPGDPDYPRLPDRTKPSDYHNRGFDKSPI